jgi:hypothetical protein
MRSIIGREASTTEKGIPYTAYSCGVKEEGSQVPAKFSSAELAYNALMQALVDSILNSHGKDYIVWRHFPEIVMEEIKDDGDTVRWYYGYARWAIED